MKNYSVPENVLNAVLNYLSTKPYVEVFEVVQAIQKNSTLISEPEPEKESPKKEDAPKAVSKPKAVKAETAAAN